MNIAKTSKEWYEILRKERDIIIMDPDGWDRSNFDYSFNKELITLDQFNMRLMSCTVATGREKLSKTQYPVWAKMTKYTGFLTKKLIPDGIFVFGSNTEGRHGKGNALFARTEFGAIYGQAKGRQGDSYAIITKDLRKKYHPSVLPEFVINQIIDFYEYAEANPNLMFYVAYSADGSLLSGFTHDELSSFFAEANPIPSNVVFENGFCKLVVKHLMD